jgi:hypothetical protein
MSRESRRRRRRALRRDRAFRALLEPYRKAYLAVAAGDDLARRVREAIRRDAPADAAGNGAPRGPRGRRLLASLGVAATLLLALCAGWLHGRHERGAEGAGPGGAAAPGARSADAEPWAGVEPVSAASPQARRAALLDTSSYLPCPPEAVVEGWRAALADPDPAVRRTARTLLRICGRLLPPDEGP